MATRLQLRKGTTTEHSTFVGANGEVTVDTDKDVLVVHDSVTAGGFPVAARANTNGTISLIKKDGASAGVINAAGLFNNTLTSTNRDQALTAAQGKVLQDNKLDKTAITVSGSAPMYACRAWVNFNGTGTVAIIASGNVSSITDHGLGDYKINFTTALEDNFYSACGSVSSRGRHDSQSVVLSELANNGVSVYCQFGGDNTVGRFDPSTVCVQVVR